MGDENSSRLFKSKDINCIIYIYIYIYIYRIQIKVLINKKTRIIKKYKVTEGFIVVV